MTTLLLNLFVLAAQTQAAPVADIDVPLVDGQSISFEKIGFVQYRDPQPGPGPRLPRVDLMATAKFNVACGFKPQGIVVTEDAEPFHLNVMTVQQDDGTGIHCQSIRLQEFTFLIRSYFEIEPAQVWVNERLIGHGTTGIISTKSELPLFTGVNVQFDSLTLKTKPVHLPVLELSGDATFNVACDRQPTAVVRGPDPKYSGQLGYRVVGAYPNDGKPRCTLYRAKQFHYVLKDFFEVWPSHVFVNGKDVALH